MKPNPFHVLIMFYAERSGATTPWIIMLTLGASARIEAQGFATSDAAQQWIDTHCNYPKAPKQKPGLYRMIEGVGIVPFDAGHSWN